MDSRKTFFTTCTVYKNKIRIIKFPLDGREATLFRLYTVLKLPLTVSTGRCHVL